MALSDSDLKKVKAFIKRMRAALATGDFTIEPTIKNKAFDRKFNLRNSQKLSILKSLTENDCIAAEPNDNPRYPETDVYKFIKSEKLMVYGEAENVKLYIKAYIDDDSYYDFVLVISFHEEGMHDQLSC